MSQENVEIVRQLVDAWNRFDLETALPLIDPDIEVEVAIGTPMDGTYHGHQGLIQFLTGMWEPFDAIRSDLGECIPVGDDVVLNVHHHGTGRGSGAEVQMRHWQVCTVRGGKVVRWRNLRTREDALEAAGLSE